MPKANLDKTWTYGGKDYGPGEGVDVPDEAHEAIKDKGGIVSKAKASKADDDA